MKITVIIYVDNYYTCKRIKASKDREHNLLQSLSIPQKRWQDISINFIVDLLLLQEHNVIWVIIDRLIKERHYVLCTTEDDETSIESTIEMLIKEIFRLHELSTSIMFDRGPQFVTTIWKSFCKRLNIQIKLFTIFHFEINEQIERSNQNLKRYLRTYCNYMQNDWIKWLFIAEFANNNNVLTFIDVSFFYANKEFNPRMSFSPDIINYVIIRKRFDAAKAENIINRI